MTGSAAEKEPTVSVVVGVFNESEAIAATLDSVFAQTVGDLECIVVDDASTDDTANRLKAYGATEPRLRIIRLSTQGGLTRALKRGVEEARGTWLARIDGGDTWYREKLAKQLTFASENPHVGIIGTASEEHNESTGQRTTRTKPEGHDGIMEALWHSCPFVHSAILVRLDVVRGCGNYNPIYPCSQDYDLYCRVLFETQGYNLPDVLLHRPTHRPGSISFLRWKEQVRCTLRIRWHYYRLHHVPLSTYRHLIPLLLKLPLPAGLKTVKQRIMRGRV